MDSRFGPFLVDHNSPDLASPCGVTTDKFFEGRSLQPAGTSRACAKIGDPNRLFESHVGDRAAQARAVHVGILAEEIRYWQPCFRWNRILDGVAGGATRPRLRLLHSTASGSTDACIGDPGERIAHRLTACRAIANALPVQVTGRGARAGAATTTAAIVTALSVLAIGLAGHAVAIDAIVSWSCTDLDNLLTPVATGIAQANRVTHTVSCPSGTHERLENSGADSGRADIPFGARILIVADNPFSDGDQNTFATLRRAAPDIARIWLLQDTGRDGFGVNCALIGELAIITEEGAIAKVTVLQFGAVFISETIANEVARYTLAVHAAITICAGLFVVTVHDFSGATTLVVALVIHRTWITIVTGLCETTNRLKFRGSIYRL